MRFNSKEPETSGMQTDAPMPTTSGSWARLAAPFISLIIVTAAVALALVSRDVTDRQAHELLNERASELSAILSVSITDARSNLRIAGLAATSAHGKVTFDSVAGTAAAQGRATTVVLQDRGSGLVTIDAAGPLAAKAGAPVDPVVRNAINRALSSPDMIAEIVTRAGARDVILALATPGNDPQVTYTESPVTPATPAPSSANSPYRELNVAVYAGNRARADQQILVSGDEPGQGSNVAERPLKVGADSWIIRVSARDPLVGSVAVVFPQLVLWTGIALALAVGLLVNILVRRRAYALRLVAERTRSLLEAQQAAERANEAKSEFLSRMSHELRTPLNAVMGFAQLVAMDDLTNDQQENIEQIRRGGSHLLDLINEILDISQIESGNMSMSLESVSLIDVIDEAARLIAPLADDRTIHLLAVTEHDPDWHVFADRQRLKQILLNLLSNGIKYNHPGGSVSISCFEASPGRVRVQVTDTGPGIPPEKRDLLFIPFERLGAEQTTIEGTGVGLALSRRLAEAMDSHLDLDTTPGRGSTFWVELPLVDPPTGTSSAADIDEVGAQSGEPPIRILQIEDNPANIALIERVLGQRPEVTVISAMQGRMGLELARRHQPALILLDLNLADVPGDQILALLHADPITADIPVVVVSADAMPRQIQRLMSQGAVDYLTKPIDIRQLLAVVDEAVDRAHRSKAELAGQPVPGGG
jgi:signal transduction histidine kinase/CheY-like chemotaxis protein